MKTLTKTLMIGMLALGLNLAQAAEQVTVGAKGGRLLENDSPRVEFFLEKDRTVTLTFYGADLKPVPAQEQSATAIAETPQGKIKIEFDKKGEVLVSKSPLPAGDKYTVVLQLKQTADAKPKNFRIPLNTSICEKCHHPEYACTCGDD
jgi:hypothetical protein